MKLKKVLTMAVCGMLAVSVLASCSSNTGTDASGGTNDGNYADTITLV